jgi:steroid delta-isomerase-like uncharacterized protein
MYLNIIMSETENLNAVTRFIEEVCNKGNLDEIDNLFSEDIVWHGGEYVTGVIDFKENMEMTRKTWPDMNFKIQDSFAADNKVVIRWVVTATHEGEFMGIPPSHEKFDTWGMEIFHFESGKIKEAWTVFDALTPAMKIGLVEPVLPPNSS